MLFCLTINRDVFLQVNFVGLRTFKLNNKGIVKIEGNGEDVRINGKAGSLVLVGEHENIGLQNLEVYGTLFIRGRAKNLIIDSVKVYGDVDGVELVIDENFKCNNLSACTVNLSWLKAGKDLSVDYLSVEEYANLKNVQANEINYNELRAREAYLDGANARNFKLDYSQIVRRLDCYGLKADEVEIEHVRVGIGAIPSVFICDRMETKYLSLLNITFDGTIRLRNSRIDNFHNNYKGKIDTLGSEIKS
jgi:hypothetical protein